MNLRIKFMNITAKSVFTTVLLIFSAANLGCGSNLIAETPGQVTSVVIDRDTKNSRRKTSSNKKKRTTKTTVETEIDYSYTANGKSYTGYAEKDGDVKSTFSVGSQVVVCYNPQNPEESDVFAAGTKCGG